MEPCYPLDEVKRICVEENIELGKTRCLDYLTAHVDPLQCIEFARCVGQELTLDDFCRVAVLKGGVKYDEYGVRLSPGLREQFNVTHLGNFYVKLRIAKPGRLVFFLSLHEMEEAMQRRGGWLDTGRGRKK